MPKKILVVDDCRTILFFVTSRLTDSGYEVISASSAQEGLEKMRESKPDLVILDVVMPKMDGFELCRIIKSDPELKTIPVIFLTVATQKWDAAKAREVGADGYITKPYQGAALVEEIEKFLKE